MQLCLLYSSVNTVNYVVFSAQRSQEWLKCWSYVLLIKQLPTLMYQDAFPGALADSLLLLPLPLQLLDAYSRRTLLSLPDPAESVLLLPLTGEDQLARDDLPWDPNLLDGTWVRQPFGMRTHYMDSNPHEVMVVSRNQLSNIF